MKTILTASFLLITSLTFALSPCSDLFSNCVATAIENYENGTYNFDQFYTFYTEICPAAYGDCADL